MGALSVVTAATAEPVSAADLKPWVRVDTNDENLLLDQLCRQYRERAEVIMHRQIMSATYDYFLDGFPRRSNWWTNSPGANLSAYGPTWANSRNQFWLPLSPVSAVTWIKYYDMTGTQQTLSTDIYTVDTASEPARIGLKYAQIWPPALTQLNAVTIRFVAGYASVAAVPQGIKSWILQKATKKYWNRETDDDESTDAETALLAQYSVMEFV